MAGPQKLVPHTVETFVLRAPAPATDTPFGPNSGRQTVLVRITDEDGAVGWGETWSTFPVGGGPHRAGLIRNVLAPLLIGRSFEDPPAAYRHLMESTRLLALQAGEPGPLAQAVAGVDIALWDLSARRAGLPLWRFLGAAGPGQIPVYASGIPAECAEDLIVRMREQGHRAFKVRLWGEGIDWCGRLWELRQVAGEMPLMADANQLWTVEQAERVLRGIGGIDLGWIEEPIAADSEDDDWRRLKAVSPTCLAGGENFRSEREFDHALQLGALSVVQPDLCKWGGLSGCLPLARRIQKAGRRYCPHFLGGGVGLMASAHLLAAVGGDGLLEVDVMPNPLREEIIAVPPIVDGRLDLPEAPGLGLEPDERALDRFATE